MREHAAPIYKIILVKNRIFTSSLDKSYVLWNLESRKVDKVIPNKHMFEQRFYPIGDMIFDKNNNVVISVASGDIAFSIVRFKHI